MGDVTPRRAPEPVKRSYVSPAAAAGLLRCALQLAYRDDPVLRHVPPTPALLIGTIAHEVLELAGAGRLDGPAGARTAWDSALNKQKAKAAADPLMSGWPADPRRWPFYAVKRARTVRLAASLAAVAGTRGSGGHGSIRLEQAGQAEGGRLRGRIDVVRPGPPKIIEDYKTGAVADPDDGAVKDDYLVQMLLYAVIEHERDGIWPEEAVLIPVQGAALAIPVDPARAEEVKAAAMQALDAYDAAPPAPGIWELAAPSPHACARCPFSVQCGPFWDACGESWLQDGVRAAAGEVSRVTRSGDSLSVTIDSSAGSQRGALTIRNLHPSHVAHLGDLAAGQPVGVTGFAASPNPGEAWATYGTRVERGGTGGPG